MCKLRVDTRAGSNALILPLRDAGVEVEACILPFGDIAFVGRGPEDCPWNVGIEHKRIPDVLSCIGTGRFAGHQLIGMSQHYNCRWLLIEDEWRADAYDTLQIRREVADRRTGQRKLVWVDARIGRRRFTTREMHHWLMTMTMIAGVHVALTESQAQSIAWLKHTYTWWTTKAWDEHHAHEAMHGIPPAGAAVELSPPSLVQRVAAQLAGIGYGRAKGVAKHFRSVFDLANADVAEWHAALEMGRDAATPRRVWNQIRGLGSRKDQGKQSWRRGDTADGERG